MKLTNRETPHAWYYNQHSDKSGYHGAENLFYNNINQTIYSYGPHYPIARKTNDIVLFTIDGSGYTNTSSYGQTTSCHVSLVRRAIPSTTLTIFVEDPSAESKRDHIYNYNHLLELVKSILPFIAKGRNNTGAQDRRVNDVRAIIEQANQYTKLFKLGKRQLSPDAFLAPDALDNIKKRELARQKKARAEWRREQEAKELRSAEAINEWKEGQRTNLPWGIDKVFLRISTDGTHVETSQGASIKLTRAIKLFAYVNEVNEGTIQFRSLEFGSFKLMRVTPTHITIGCHRISIEEMERINDLL